VTDPSAEVREFLRRLGPAVIVDTETSGRDPERHALLELGMVFVRDGLVVAEWFAGIEAWEGAEEEPEAMVVNGYRDRYRLGTPMPAEGALRLAVQAGRQVLGSDRPWTWIGHNVPFDRRFVASSVARVVANNPGAREACDLMSCFGYRDVDTMALATVPYVVGAIPSRSLDAVAAAAGKTRPAGQPHTAIDDAERTFEALVWLLGGLRWAA